MLQIHEIEVSKLIPYVGNARKHDDKNVTEIASSITEYGFNDPIAINEKDNVIIEGHGRLLAAKKLGMATVPVLKLGHLSPAQIKGYTLIHNRLAEKSEWDKDILETELLKLQEMDFDVGSTGFDTESIAEMDLNIGIGDGDGDKDDDKEDDIPELEDKNPYGVKRGDIWLLGNHRVMCGDSTDKADVDRLMDGHKADMVFTSPPYGQQRDYGEAKAHVQEWDNLMNGVFGNLPFHENTQVFVNLGLIHKDNEWVPYWENWMKCMAETWRRCGWYVWDQGSGLPGDWGARLGPSFEFIWHFNKKNRKPNKTVEKLQASIDRVVTSDSLAFRDKSGKVEKINSPELTNQPMKIMDSVIRQVRHLANDIARKSHPATFPIGLPEKFIEAYLYEDESCFDPFLGSGSTLIACEKTNRQCYGSEIDPHYCSVIIKRWEEYTGKEAVKWLDVALN